jgi:hypothetical protein
MMPSIYRGYPAIISYAFIVSRFISENSNSWVVGNAISSDIMVRAFSIILLNSLLNIRSHAFSILGTPPLFIAVTNY